MLFVSSWGAAHAYVAQALVDAGLDVRVLHVLPGADPDRPPLWRRVAAHPGRSVAGRARAWALRAPLHRLEEGIRRGLFPAGTPPPTALDAACLEAEAWALHAPATIAQVRALAPDVLLTSGAPLLRPALRNAPRQAAWNLHWGIAPAYRGGHTLFHALRAGDDAGLGITLHALDAGTDTGAIVHQEVVAADGTEAGTWVACARAAAASLPALLRAPAEAARAARPQAGVGRLYRYSERTVGRQLRRAWRERRRAAGGG